MSEKYPTNLLFFCCFFFRLAAAAEARAAGSAGDLGSGRAGPFGYGAIMGGKKRPPPQPGVKGPSSLFILSDDNCLRKYTKFIIEWPYPFFFGAIFVPFRESSKPKVW